MAASLCRGHGRTHLSGAASRTDPCTVFDLRKARLAQALGCSGAKGIEFEFRHLGNDVFNEVGWLDPSGQLVRLVEARTFSPSKRLANDTSRCGYFLEIAVPAPDRELAKAYWEAFGFVGMDEPGDRLPHISCTSDFIDLGLYHPGDLRRATLRFEVDDVGGALAHLADKGIVPNGEMPPGLRAVPAAVLVAPEGTPILLTSSSIP